MSNRYEFWDLIELARRDLPSFLRRLDDLHEDELVRFYWDHGLGENDLYMRPA